MNGSAEEQDLKDRLSLIESMIAEGRRGTESWGWTFVLWGVAYYVATAWATWGRSAWAWPVTMTVAAVVSSVAGSRLSRRRPATTLGRAVGAVWLGMGSCLMAVLICVVVSGRFDGHVIVAIVGAMLATAHGTSATILKWKAQYLCAVVWLAAAAAACFGTDAEVEIAFLGATLLAQIVFGVYAMILDSRRRRLSGVAHG